MIDCTETKKVMFNVGMNLSHNLKLVDLWSSLTPVASIYYGFLRKPFYIFSYFVVYDVAYDDYEIIFHYVAYDDFVLT